MEEPVPLALEVKNLQEVSKSGCGCLHEVGREGEKSSHQKVPCSTCFSLLPLLEILSFFLQARLCLDERDLDGGKGRRPLSSEEGVDDAFILEPISPPPNLSHPIPELGRG